MLQSGEEISEGFVTPASIRKWRGKAAMPPRLLSSPVATGELGRMRTRASAGLDVVLRWAEQRGVLTSLGVEQVRLMFIAATVNVLTDGGL
jgi:hypothetical protein